MPYIYRSSLTGRWIKKSEYDTWDKATTERVRVTLRRWVKAKVTGK